MKELLEQAGESIPTSFRLRSVRFQDKPHVHSQSALSFI